MADPFRVLTTPAFDRQARKAIRRAPELARALEELVVVLRSDPHNLSGEHKIKKLAGVVHGDGQWRIRFGDYRIRYDVASNDVILHSFRNRKDAYR